MFLKTSQEESFAVVLFSISVLGHVRVSILRCALFFYVQWNRDLLFRHRSFFRMYCSQFLVPN